jgi:hypothetical protein
VAKAARAKGLQILRKMNFLQLRKPEKIFPDRELLSKHKKSEFKAGDKPLIKNFTGIRFRGRNIRGIFSSSFSFHYLKSSLVGRKYHLH